VNVFLVSKKKPVEMYVSNKSLPPYTLFKMRLRMQCPNAGLSSLNEDSIYAMKSGILNIIRYKK
jgi:hypothetical protein